MSSGFRRDWLPRWHNRGSKCPSQCSICPCRSMGTSPAPTTIQPDLLGLGPDRVSHIDVDVQADAGARQFSAESDSNPAVMVILSNSLCRRVLGIEDEPDGDGDGGYLADQDEYVFGMILETVGGQVYVARPVRQARLRPSIRIDPHALSAPGDPENLRGRRAGSTRPLVSRFASPCAGDPGIVGRPRSPWSLESQHDLQGVANGVLGAAERSGHLDQCRRPSTLSPKPAAQCFPCDLRPFAVAKPDHID